jgi:hypothetical protein
VACYDAGDGARLLGVCCELVQCVEKQDSVVRTRWCGSNMAEQSSSESSLIMNISESKYSVIQNLGMYICLSNEHTNLTSHQSSCTS